MRFLMTIHATESTKRDEPPDPKLMAAIQALAEEEIKQGKMITTGGLGWSVRGARVAVRDAKLEVVDGPFAETKELLSGFAIFELASLEEAVEHAKRFMKLHLDVLGPGYEGSMEVHPIFGA
ncbi:MAG: hypothetical protein KIS78_09085 [Labilithrix sp.]|nr:hypothetical protein [Labilithrix sp.]MCW5832549.1 hypothetical protein [Labilithrix sp.]